MPTSLTAFSTKTQVLKLGDLDEATDIGSIINNKQFTKVCGYVEEGCNARTPTSCSVGCHRRKARSARGISRSLWPSPTPGHSYGG
jgi:betaine-aldehyde dehydrogenase